VEIEQRANDEMIGSTAVAAVAHSDAMGAPEQLPELGAMDSRRAAGSCWRVERYFPGVGIARVLPMRRRTLVSEAIIVVRYRVLWRIRWFGSLMIDLITGCLVVSDVL
jgi:hypothetical protein